LIALLDACVVIDVLRSNAAARSALARAGTLAASEVTRFEVLAGRRPGEEAATEAPFDGLDWLVVDEGVARRASALARDYRPSHSGIDDADYLVAATALEYGAQLLTTNVRHFPMLPDLAAAY
jgi:predicted nucleic acid-binding protein